MSHRNSDREQAALSFLSKVATGFDIPKTSTPTQEIFSSPTTVPNSRQQTISRLQVSERDQAAIGFLSNLQTFQDNSAVLLPSLNSIAATSNSEDDVRIFGESLRKSATTRFSVIDTLKGDDDLLICYTWKSGPCTLFSLIPHKPTKKKHKQSSGKQATPFINPYLEKLGLATAIDSFGRKKTAHSYAPLLEQQGVLGSDQASTSASYNPYFLDNPEMNLDRNKMVITLPSFLGSIIQPTTPSEIKQVMNQRFKETHPGVDYTLTLSQIRVLKKEICTVCFKMNMEILTIAAAIVYLEKLILLHYVNKSNKRLIAGACILLAAKVHDTKDRKYGDLMACIEDEMDVTKKDVFAEEFPCYAALEFNLFVPKSEVEPHMIRIQAYADEHPI